jgi:hypothetical protein
VFIIFHWLNNWRHDGKNSFYLLPLVEDPAIRWRGWGRIEVKVERGCPLTLPLSPQSPSTLTKNMAVGMPHSGRGEGIMIFRQ